MTPKQITYTDHALARLAQRGISRRSVKRILATGVRNKATTRIGAQQRWEARGRIGKIEASIIYIETAHTIEVITVQWIT